jgi:hypothetical protein
LAERGLFQEMVKTNRAILAASEEEIAMERRELDRVHGADVRVMLESISLTREGGVGDHTSALLEERKEESRERGGGEEELTDDSMVALRILEAWVRTMAPPS